MKKLLIVAALLTGCVQLPPSPADIEAKKFQVPSDRSAVYVVRTPMDSWETSPVSIGDRQVGTHRGTYYRWDVAPGMHQVYASLPGAVTLNTAAGKAYFLEHTVIGDPQDGGVQVVRLREIGEQAGRQLVTNSEMAR